jgi:hypothetical protein
MLPPARPDATLEWGEESVRCSVARGAFLVLGSWFLVAGSSG